MAVAVPYPGVPVVLVAACDSSAGMGEVYAYLYSETGKWQQV